MAQPAFAHPTPWPPYWSEEDLSMLPDDGHRYEIIDGSLHVTPPASYEHQSTGMQLAFLLRTAAPRGWRVRYGLGVRVPGGNLIPDLAVLYPQVAPDADWQEASHVALAVEVASSSTAAYDKGTKAIKYAEAGIPAYWRVDRDGSVTVHALMDEAQYGIVATVKPGATWTASFPYEVTLDPDTLVADL